MGVFGGVELDDLVLRGPRLTLRPWRAGDAPRVHEIMQDAAMAEFLAIPDPYTHEDAVGFVTDLGDEGRRDGTGIGCAVVETATGRLVGSAALRVGTSPDVGYWIAPDAQGHGYATEAVRVLCDWGFVHGPTRIALYCDVRNVASARTALAAGFHYEGALRDRLRRSVAGSEQVSDLAVFSRVSSDDGEPVAPAFAPFPATACTTVWSHCGRYIPTTRPRSANRTPTR